MTMMHLYFPVTTVLSKLHSLFRSFFLIAVKRIPKPVKICNAEVDIGFIVDVSTSLLDLSSYKQYIKNIAQGFGISKAGTRAGIVSYAAKATLDIKLSDHTSADSFIKAVNKINLKSSSGSTNIDEAFNLAYTKLFSKKNGARNHVPQLIVMLTSGKYDQNRNNLSTSKNVSAIHEAGIKVIVLATGSAVNRKQITAIGKIPENIFFVKNLTELISEKFIRKTGTRACLNTGK